MELKHMYGRREFDTRAIRAGAVEHVVCPTCGAAPAAPCLFQPSGQPIPDFAHISRRFEYVEGRGTFYPEPRVIPPEIWLRCKQDRHAECLPHPVGCKCGHPPDPCECPCHKKSNSDVDDLLG
jgi:hypothetical protein